MNVCHTKCIDWHALSKRYEDDCEKCASIGKKSRNEALIQNRCNKFWWSCRLKTCVHIWREKYRNSGIFACVLHMWQCVSSVAKLRTHKKKKHTRNTNEKSYVKTLTNFNLVSSPYLLAERMRSHFSPFDQ